jgi:hypothetical protein
VTRLGQHLPILLLAVARPRPNPPLLPCPILVPVPRQQGIRRGRHRPFLPLETRPPAVHLRRALLGPVELRAAMHRPVLGRR